MSEDTLEPIEFKAWPKIARLNRDCIVTEKIDGTNSAVIVRVVPNRKTKEKLDGTALEGNEFVRYTVVDGGLYYVAAQSRKRLIKPGRQSDNAGFARWVWENAAELAVGLGEGIHFGEWFGQAIQHAYGLDHKRWYLFNTERWTETTLPQIENVGVVPTLYEGPFSTDVVNAVVSGLRADGSVAVPGQKSEGVVVFHKAANIAFKVLCENDELPKGVDDRVKQ